MYTHTFLCTKLINILFKSYIHKITKKYISTPFIIYYTNLFRNFFKQPTVIPSQWSLRSFPTVLQLARPAAGAQHEHPRRGAPTPPPKSNSQNHQSSNLKLQSPKFTPHRQFLNLHSI